MSTVDITAVVLWLGVTAYAVFGGADFGGGFWDLVAGRGEQGDRARALIADSIGPVWETNHTWLIFDLVVLWTAFPVAFAAIMTTLFVPLSLAAFGIVLRGAASRSARRPGVAGRRAAGAVFAASSVITPFFLGDRGRGHRRRPRRGRGPAGRPHGLVAEPDVGAGRVSRGRRPVPTSRRCSWSPTHAASPALPRDLLPSTRDLGRGSSPARCRSPGSWCSARRADHRGQADPRRLAVRRWRRSSSGPPRSSVSPAGGVRGTRVLAVGAVVSVVWGWGIAQFPDILPGELTLADAAAPSGALDALLVVFVVAALLIAPSIALLYTLTQRNRLGGHA